MPALAPTPVAVIDALNALLEAELSSLFRFVGEGSPYLSRADAGLRQSVADMVASAGRNVGSLTDLVDRLGGVPTTRRVVGEEQYLAYLSLRFLLPKLVEAKELMIRRYDNALKGMGAAAPAEAKALLNEIADRHRADLQVLQRATADAAPQGVKTPR
jgi:hypothetical protein